MVGWGGGGGGVQAQRSGGGCCLLFDVWAQTGQASVSVIWQEARKPKIFGILR